MKIIIITLTSLLLSGCTIFQAMSLQSDVKDCQEKITKTSDYLSLNASHYMPWKDTFLDTHPSAVDLMDKSFATKDEIAKFIGIHNMVQGCRKIVVEDLSGFAPQMIPKLVNGFMEADKVFADLFEQKITWGQFSNEFKTILSTLAQDLKQDTLRAEMEREGKLREFTANAVSGSLNFVSTVLQAWATSQTRMYSVPVYNTYTVKPVITNCTINSYSSSSKNVSCSSY